MYLGPPPQKPERSVFHQPAAMVPGGQEFRPPLIEQQKTVQPDEQFASGPHTDAYAVPGRSMKRHGFNASADPTTAERNRKPRRLDLLASPLLTIATTFSEIVTARAPALGASC